MTRAQTVGLGLTGLAVVVLLGSLVLGMRGEPGPAPAAGGAEPTGPRVRVEVLNAAGVPGLAREATDTLRDQGFDVVYFGNGRGFAPESSLVLDRVGNEEAARAVADAVGISRVRSRPDSTLYLDVTVVLGRDWRGAEADTAAAPPEG